MEEAVSNYNDFTFMHLAPRFGHSHNIAQLASTDLTRRKDYANGLFAFSAFFLAFFFLWSFMEIIFKWLGIRRVGCLAGEVMFQPNDIHMSESRIVRRHRIVQLGFILAGGVVFSGGGVFLMHGLPTIQIALKETLVLNEDSRLALDKGLSIANTVVALRARILTSTAHKMLLSDDYCVDSSDNIAGLLLGTGGDYTEDSIKIFSDFQDKLRDEEVDGVKSGIIHILQNLTHVDNILELYESYNYVARGIILILFNLCFFLMMSAIVLMIRRRPFPPMTFMSSYFVLPLFIFFLFIIWVINAVVAIGTIINADVCVGSGEGPESTIQNALLENGFNVKDLTYESFLYYKSDCTIPQPWDTLTSNYRESIQKGVDVAAHVLSRIDEIGEGVLMNACGRDFMPIITEVDRIKRDMMLLSNSLDDALEQSRCERVAPIYRTFFNGPICTESIEGLNWALCGLLAVSVGGAILFTLRAALYQIEVVHNDDDEIDSLDDTAKEKLEIQAQIGKSRTMDSNESDPSFVSGKNTNEICDAIEQGASNAAKSNYVIDQYHGDIEALTPAVKVEHHFDASLDLNSPNSTLSSKLSNMESSFDLSEGSNDECDALEGSNMTEMDNVMDQQSDEIEPFTPTKEGILDPLKSSDALIDLDSPDSAQSSTLSESFQLDDPSIPTQRETQW